MQRRCVGTDTRKPTARRFEPHEYQRYCIDRLVSEEKVGLFLDMGLGKSAIVLSAVRELMLDRLEVEKCLVIAPKKVAEATWQTEAQKWEQFNGLRIATVLGSATQRERELARHADIYVTNRENTEWLVDYYAQSGRAWPFDMLVVDESSSFKNPTSKRFRALKRALPRVRRVVILTGTPAPNGVEDLWAQVYLLDQGARLGRTITEYRNTYFDYNQWRHEFKPKEGTFETVRARIGDICVSMSASDYLRLPDLLIEDFPVVLDARAAKQYKELEREMLLQLPDGEITALSAAALTGKLLQLCNGAVYDADAGVHEIHRGKLEVLTEALEGLQGEPALVFYGYKHDVPRILSAIDKGLRVRQLDSAADAAAWNAGEVDVLLAHPASCAYGLNLQQGGRHVIWFSLPWSLELYQQANARLYRQGQDKPVTVQRLIVKDGVDMDVAAALEDKTDTQDALLSALKARMERAKEGLRR